MLLILLVISQVYEQNTVVKNFYITLNMFCRGYILNS